jgi:hypothetical protein
LCHQGLELSPHTIRHILRRLRPPQSRRRRKPLYPANWAWEVEDPFSLLQTDVKHILDKGALGTRITTHLTRQHLPRYQWTACDGRTRLRFLAYSHRITRTNGLAFMLLSTLFLRALGFESPITFQTDWGQEFGGDIPAQVAALSAKFLEPLGAQLARYPKGRKGYNGRVERSHRTDDEEFYRPYLLNIHSESDFLAYAHKWTYFYNALRPHFGHDMRQSPPLAVLEHLGYPSQKLMAAFPPVLLDDISTDLLCACDPEDGIDVLAQYMFALVLLFSESVTSWLFSGNVTLWTKE